MSESFYVCNFLFSELCDAATKIQASFRGHLTRKQEADKKHEEGGSTNKPGEKVRSNILSILTKVNVLI